eukprot:4196317-Karenia_brevis.AAC.1
MAEDIDASNVPIDSEGDLDLQIDLDLCSDNLEDEIIFPTEESYSFNMVAEQSDEEETPDSPESRRLKKSKEFWRQMKTFMDKMFQQERKGNVSSEKLKRCSLDE